ncbi:MAG: phosphotransferase [Sandaracinus sp.]|nr:phosphotransferase [Sandaracinus sp.]
MTLESVDAATPEAAQHAVESLVGEALRVEPSRRVRGNPPESFRVHLVDGRAVVATCRATATRTAFEAHALRSLRERGASVPRVLAARGGWLIQEDLGSLRLSQRLDSVAPTEAPPLLHAAIDALVAVHASGRAAGLDRDAPTLPSPTRYLPMPERLASLLGLPAPFVDTPTFEQTLAALPGHSFVKRDARPARAVVRGTSIVWFDFARCGRGHRLLDLVALLGDEALAERPKVEDDLLDAHLPRFLDSLHLGRAFFAVYGVLYLTRRMVRILELKGGGDWWPIEECLDADHPIVTEHALRTLALRAQRWAERHPLTESLAPFYLAIATR